MTAGLLKIFLYFFLLSNSLLADPIKGKAAILNLLDKTTNKVSQKTINVNSTVDWDSLNIQIYACYSTSPEEIPENYVLLEVLDALKPEEEYLYRGWMISSSPDVTPLEHPIYDLWLVECKIDRTS